MKLSLSTSLSGFTKSAVPFVGVLDGYATGLVSALSVWRRLLASYQGAILRVRRSVDDAEEDFSPGITGLVPPAALLEFCGAGDGFVTRVYNQGGTGSDLIQTTSTRQMRIVHNGVLETLGGQASAFHSGADSTMGYSAVVPAYTGLTLSVFARGLIPGSGFQRFVSVSSDAGVDYADAAVAAIITTSASENKWDTYRQGDAGMALNTPSTANGLISYICDGVNQKLRDGTNTESALAYSAPWGFNRLLIGMASTDSPNTKQNSQWTEVVMWTADQTANEAAIRTALT